MRKVGKECTAIRIGGDDPLPSLATTRDVTRLLHVRTSVGMEMTSVYINDTGNGHLELSTSGIPPLPSGCRLHPLALFVVSCQSIRYNLGK